MSITYGACVKVTVLIKDGYEVNRHSSDRKTFNTASNVKYSILFIRSSAARRGTKLETGPHDARTLAPRQLREASPYKWPT